MSVRVPLSDVAYPPRCQPGDRVAIVSPSSFLPAIFPHVHDLGIARLQDEFELVPVEYPTTRRFSAPEERAQDLMAAFTDDSISAVMATIGGDDQITVLPHLDFDVIARNPKPFFGYSDNTNLLNALVLSGIVGYHGGSTMVQLGRSVEVHPQTAASLWAALLDGGRFELASPDTFANHPLPWDDPRNLAKPTPTHAATPWVWHGSTAAVKARLWGGCLEVLDWTMQVGRWVGEPTHYQSSVLFIETSEEMPTPEYVFCTLRNLGERGILEQLAALIVARPISERLGERTNSHEIAAIEDAQREAVVGAMDRYNPHVPMLFGLDAGHTDPQFILPLGGLIELDPEEQTVHVVY
jgi:muramoyltetrapeptide carboxypeptidase LdcA involved in peptidoglycan recycling